MGQIDFHITNNGSTFSFTPVTPTAIAWVDDLPLEDWQWLGPSFVVDHRLAHDLVNGIVDAGFEVA